jgi:acetyltransferase-like isoleucine patch superfamily enzyme
MNRQSVENNNNMHYRVKFAIRLFLASFIRRFRYYRYRLKGYDIKKTTIIERDVNLGRVYPEAIHIGNNTTISARVSILSHEHNKRVNGLPLKREVFIGDRCSIGTGAIIIGGVTIGDEVIVGAGAVVVKDVPSNCIVAGNPAKVVRTGIRLNDKREAINWSLEKGWF